MSTYDYIIIGAGASGLLLADALGRDTFFKDKSILLLDKSDKSSNDRTWCFWEKGSGPFDDILYKTWSKIHFAGKHVNRKTDIRPYSYKMVRGIDFYQHFLGNLKSYANVGFQLDDIEFIKESHDEVHIKGKKNSYSALQVFDSRFDYEKLKEESKYPVLQQHFLGWFVKTDQPVFDVETPTFMDFSIAQNGNTRFMYVLPFSKHEALVEYTLFSGKVLKKEEYENAIKDYLSETLGVGDYDITEVEQGNIPMSSYNFSKKNTSRILKIGIAGGWAKASTGYTFFNTTKRVKKLVEFLKSGVPLSKFEGKTRFWWYDLLFLDVLHQNNHLGSIVFESLFRKRKPQLILKFLDQDTNPWEELQIMWSCPKLLFTKALWNRVF